MGTTLIIVELLIIGCEVLAWVVLLLRMFFPELKTVICLDRWKECIPLLATLAVATAYTLGVVGDRLLGHASTVVQHRLSPDANTTGDDPQLAVRRAAERAKRDFYMTEIFRPHAHEYFQDSNRQIRLLRATCFNSIITALVLFFFYRRHWENAWIMCLLLLFLGFLSGLTWYMTDKTLKERQDEFLSACQKNREVSVSAMETKW